MDQLKEQCPATPTYIFLDNLNVHHNKEVKEYAKTLGFVFVFNAAYYSEINMIERLWNYSKRAFTRRIVNEPDWKNHGKVRDLVLECLRGVSPATLEAHGKTCLERMISDYE